MPAKLLKEVQIRNARTESGERLLSDGGGLFLRVRPTGDKSWLFIAQVAGKRHKHGLGAYPEVSLAKAREFADGARKHVADGIDPTTAKRAAQAEQRAKAAATLDRMTVGQLFELWHEREVSRRKDLGAEVRRIFEKDVLPVLGKLPSDSIGRRHIMDVLDTVKERGARRLANVLLQNLRQLFRFGAIREIIATDPTFGLSKSNVGGKETVRERFLSDREINELVTKLPAAGLTATAEAALWLMLATAARVGEVSTARWADFNMKDKTWTIPASVAKNGREHVVHLSKFAARQIDVMRQYKESDEWMLPNREGNSHICTKALQRQFHDRQRDEPLRGRTKATGTLSLSGGAWRAHDLRRTAATLMGEAGVRSDVIERCLNHVGDNKLVITYQRQQLISERTEAFDLLGKKIELVIRSAQRRATSRAKPPVQTQDALSAR